MNPLTFLTIILVLFLSISSTRTATIATNSIGPGNGAQRSLPAIGTNNCVTFDFHYLILSDEKRSSNTRVIEIFMDEKAFSEENLKKLFRYLSDKNPDPNPSPNNLKLYVYTDWKQLDVPSDCPPTARSGGDSGRDAYDYHWARFHRREGREVFVYNPVKKVWKDKDVIMKGNKIFRNGAWQLPATH